MTARKRYLAVAAAVILASCGSLPRSLRDEIASEQDKLQQADRQLKRTAEDVKDMPDRLRAAQDELNRARADGTELDKVVKDSGRIGIEQARRRAESLLRDERSLRQAALRDSDAIEADSTKRRDFEKNAPQNLARMKSEYEQIHSFDLTPVEKTVQKAEQDWPARKADLDARLGSLKQIPDSAATQWQTAEATPVSAGTVATLVSIDDQLASEAREVSTGADQLKALSGQLYNSWDKILVDLDKGREGMDTVYREKIKTVKTHYVDVPAKKTEVTSSENWTDVSASAYRSVENDLGMSIAHKDAGLYDSEAVNIAQPPGFAYMATPEQGRNQYGYWSNAGGGSVWTWLPEYLIMRELFWGPRYQPIYINEYHGYQTAMRSGRPYYGQETPAAPPKYGSHGTFTEQHYSSSRYVQSGGFKGSAYSSSRGSAAAPSSSFGHAEPEPGSGVGKRFGGGSSAPSGRQFGHTPMPRPSGKSFGRRR
jgi:outer membrane murein-binding lipoprotein Lpp